MSHTISERRKLLARVRRIRGTVDGIERALSTEARCERVMHLIAGALKTEAAEQWFDVVRT